MLRRFLILIVVMIVIVEARKILPNLIGGSTGLLPGTGTCRTFRRDCNVCNCPFFNLSPVDQCTRLDCNNLPENVRRGNAVADANLPEWPGESIATPVGQVYRWKCGFCVRETPSSSYCISQC